MIDVERLRKDLIDYFGAAMMYYPQTMINLSEVENADYNSLIDIALRNGFNLDNYRIKYKKL